MQNDVEMMRKEAEDVYRSEGYSEDVIAEFIRQDMEAWRVAVRSALVNVRPQ